ncbi:MAG: 1-deoxy-D-xylulose-5-phosphate synthase, partial [Gammaproteobacteria bacterium]
PLPIGKAEVRRRGQRIALLAFGALLAPACKAAEALNATAVNMRFVKPLDQKLILELAASHEALVTLEDNAIAGGAGVAVGELLSANGVTIPLLHLGLSDRFLEHASREELLSESGLDAGGIEAAIRERFAELTAISGMRSTG